MKPTIDELRNIISTYTEKIEGMSASEFTAKPVPSKWSKQEVLGHLIDSAQNNLRRFICGQYETIPSKIVYDQDFWVAVNGYQQMKKEHVVALWKLINERIAAVLEKMPEKNYTKTSETSEPHTLQWLAVDYVKHLKHHLNQIIPGSFDINYK
jgi:hypothetical protein